MLHFIVRNGCNGETSHSFNYSLLKKITPLFPSLLTTENPLASKWIPSLFP